MGRGDSRVGVALHGPALVEGSSSPNKQRGKSQKGEAPEGVFAEFDRFLLLCLFTGLSRFSPVFADLSFSPPDLSPPSVGLLGNSVEGCDIGVVIYGNHGAEARRSRIFTGIFRAPSSGAPSL